MLVLGIKWKIAQIYCVCMGIEHKHRQYSSNCEYGATMQLEQSKSIFGACGILSKIHKELQKDSTSFGRVVMKGSHFHLGSK